MKIVVIHSGGKFTLASGGEESPVDLAIDETRVTQIDEIYEAMEIVARARGNRKTTISFRIEKEHKDQHASEAYLLTHQLDVPEAGDVSFTTEGVGASRTLYLRGAVIISVGSRQVGVSTIHNYAIVGGQLEKT